MDLRVGSSYGHPYLKDFLFIHFYVSFHLYYSLLKPRVPTPAPRPLRGKTSTGKTPPRTVIVVRGYCGEACFSLVPSSTPVCPSIPLRPHSNLPKPLSYAKKSKFTSQVIKGHGRICELFDLHQEHVPYDVAWYWQKEIVKEKKTQIEKYGDCSDTLIVLQHPSVYTLGTASTEENLNFDMKNAPFHVYRTERGGEVTYHGPGQIVMYPIINLRRHKMDLHWYLRTLEEVVIRVLSSTFSIQASRLEGLTGVWVGNEKLAAVGIRVARWITYHGLALNVTTDLSPFKRIVPCGIRDRQVGSIKGLLREAQSCISHGATDLHNLDDACLIDTTSKSLIEEFSQAFMLEYHNKTISVPVLYEREKISRMKETQQS